MSNSEPVALSDSYRFEGIVARSQRLPPRGQLRVVSASIGHGAGSTPTPALNHTLLFSSLLAAPFYQEAIVTHCSVPAPGKHGPFNIDDLSPADFVEVSAGSVLAATRTHLDYQRMRCAPIAAGCRRHVLGFIGRLTGRPGKFFALRPCRPFSDDATRYHAHEWSHALLEFHEYLALDQRGGRLINLMFAFD